MDIDNPWPTGATIEEVHLYFMRLLPWGALYFAQKLYFEKIETANRLTSHGLGIGRKQMAKRNLSSNDIR